MTGPPASKPPRDDASSSSTEALPPEAPIVPGGRWLRVAFVAWGLGGVVTAQGLEISSSIGAPFPCALCAKVWCWHRAVGHFLLHVLGLAVLWVAATRAHGGSRESGGWGPYVAGAVPLVLGFSTVLEFVEVETVLATGPILGLTGVALLTPAARRFVRAMGWVSLVTSLVGYYLVVLGHLSPSGARVPLLAVGLAGLAASIVAAVVTRNRAPGARESAALAPGAGDPVARDPLRPAHMGDPALRRDGDMRGEDLAPDRDADVAPGGDVAGLVDAGDPDGASESAGASTPEGESRPKRTLG